jgi:hypothetical protein
MGQRYTAAGARRRDEIVSDMGKRAVVGQQVANEDGVGVTDRHDPEGYAFGQVPLI